MGKLEAAFTTSGHSAENAKGTYSALASVLGDTDVAVEASNHLAKLTSNQQELQTWTNICTGVFATFGDSLPIEGLTEAANETAKVGQVTGSLADALNWAGVSEDEFNKSLALCTTEQERQQLIMDTLNGIYDEASQKYQEVNADVIAANQAQEKYTSAMAEFGEKAQPVVNAVKYGLGDLLQAASKLVENMDFTAIEDTIDGAFSWLIDTVVPAVEGFFGFLTENKDEVIAAIVAVATGFLAWNVVTIVQGVISAIKAWKLATEGMTIAQKLLNIVMNANPLGIIITLIAAVTAAVIYLWNNSEKFRTFVQNMLNGIKSWITNAVETAEELIASLVATVTTKFQEIKDIIESKLNDAKAKFSEIWQSVKDIFSDAVDVGKQLVQDIMDGIEKSWNDLKEWFRDLWDGLFGNLSVDVEANGSSGGVDGSHASGLDYVPFDGYVAELHRGEMVVPAAEASVLRSGAGNADVASILLMILDAVQEGNNQETVLKLNNREFGRAVRGVVNA